MQVVVAHNRYRGILAPSLVDMGKDYSITLV